MRLGEVLDAISGGTEVCIHANFREVFHGRMANVQVTNWRGTVEPYLGYEIIRINNVNGAITIAV